MIHSPWEVKKDPELCRAVLEKCIEIQEKVTDPVKFYYSHGGPDGWYPKVSVTPVYYQGDFLVEDWIRVLSL